MDPRLGNVTLLDLMEPGDWPWFGNYATEPRYHSVPHPSLVHVDASMRTLPWQSTHARAVRIVGAFGVAHGPRQVVALRSALQKACDAAAPKLCTFHRLGDKQGRTNPTASYWGKRSGGTRASGGSGTPVEGPVEPGWLAIARLCARRRPNRTQSPSRVRVHTLPLADLRHTAHPGGGASTADVIAECCLLAMRRLERHILPSATRGCRVSQGNRGFTGARLHTRPLPPGAN